MWNNPSHLECYFGIPTAGGVLHTLNLRLHPHEITFIANHAGDRFLIVDNVLLPTYEKIKDHVKFERVIVAPFSGEPTPPGMDGYEQLLASGAGDFTTPRSMRTMRLQCVLPPGPPEIPRGCSILSRSGSALLRRGDGGWDGHQSTRCRLPVSSMFHANAWGVPFTSVMVGATIVLPGPHVDAESLLDLVETQHVTMACGVPTVWLGVLAALEKQPDRWNKPRNVHLVCGGTAPPEALIRSLDRYGFHISISSGE